MKHGTDTNLGFLLTRSSSLWDVLLMQEFKKRGVVDMKPSFGAVFIPLFDKDGISAKQISEFSKLTKQTLSTYIRDLERLGYIKREASTQDARSENIYLTSKGKKLRKIADSSVTNVNRHFSRMTTQEEMRSLRSILSKILSGE